MNFHHSEESVSTSLTGTLVLFIDSEDKLISHSDAFDANFQSTLSHLLSNQCLKTADLSVFSCPMIGSSKDTGLVLVRRKSAKVDFDTFCDLIRSATKCVIQGCQQDVHIDLSALEFQGRDSGQVLQHWTTQFIKAGYRFEQFKSKKGAALKPENFVFHLPHDSASDAALTRGSAIGQAVNLARTLGNRPGNHCTPAHLADEALALAKNSKTLKVSIHEEEDLRKLGMGAFLSVAAGSEQPAKLIEMSYRGTGEQSAPYVLIGKGVTFDSGGISIKPAAAMDEMKFDMCGAASVFGVMQAVELLQLPINFIGLIAATENMPSGTATKPGDIVTSMSGKTIEILNTDAEGRLVLCDTLTYAQKFKPCLMIDIATLTGACIVALGSHASGLYANQDELAKNLIDAGELTGDRVWRMPLWKEYTKQLESTFADLGNIGGPKAGSVTAACFLKEFVGDTAWAHLDIAGTAWNSSPKKDSTGKPVELLMQFLLQQTA